MKRALRSLKGNDHGVRYNDFKYSLKDLIDDGEFFCFLLEIGDILSFNDLDKILHEFSVLKIREKLVFQFPLINIVESDKFIVENVPVIFIFDLYFQSQFHELIVESMYKCFFTCETFDDSFIRYEICQKKLGQSIRSWVELFDLFRGHFELLYVEDIFEKSALQAIFLHDINKFFLF